ncbi:MAG: Fe-S cluster assembly protein SufD [bacterium]
MPETLVTVKDIEKSSLTHLSRERDEPKWLYEKRMLALEHFNRLPVPSNRYTDLSEVNLDTLEFNAPKGDTAGHPTLIQFIKEAESAVGYIIQVNGETLKTGLSPDLASKGVILTDFQTAIRQQPALLERYYMSDAIRPETDKFTALHAALCNTGALLYVPMDIQIREPIISLVINTAPGSVIFNHVLAVLENGARVAFVEEQVSDEDKSAPMSVHSQVVEAFVHPNARFEFATLQSWGARTYSFQRKKALVHRDASASWTMGWLGGRLSQSYLDNEMVGEGSSAEDLQVCFASERQHFDIQSNLGHRVGHTKGEVLVKGVLQDKSRFIFNGLIKIYPHAQQSDAFQAAHTLLLNPGARADAIPSLEIEANDVRCTHSASTGPIDEEQIFYLMSRGLNEDEARKMIVHGFFQPAIQRIPVQSVRDSITRLVDLKWRSK